MLGVVLSAERSANVIDRKLGARMRTRRLEIGTSQARLAEELGITFQQVQKYEKGINRIPASRLLDIATALRATPASFLQGLGVAGDNDSALLMLTPGAEELFRHFVGIKSPKVRRRVIDLVRAMRDDA